MLAEEKSRPGLKDRNDPSEESAGNKRGSCYYTCVSAQRPSKPECEGLKMKQRTIK